MASIETSTGLTLSFDDPQPDQIDIDDIATGLSRVCRFAGQASEFYSVAQHCCFVSDWIRKETKSPSLALLGLLHDAPEAYCCDLPRALKCMLPDYKIIETRVWGAISLKYFGEEVDLPPIIKVADNVALVTEARDFMGDPGWCKEERWPKPVEWKIRPIGMRQAWVRYLQKFYHLYSIVKEDAKTYA